MRETALFREDMEALRVLPPRQYVGAVEAMGEIAELVGKLLAQGAAYRVDDPEYPDVYFDAAATGRFGYESNYDEATMLRSRARPRRRPGPARQALPLDPLLWRMARDGEPSWESDLGAGRPGWHVECAAIALNRLGTQIDLNGGGSDLIFPHHECGAAHAEAFTGVHPFARHYTHTGMIGLDGAKMSKSRGNLVFVSKLRAQGVDPNAVRLALLAGHYRSDREWTADLLTDSAAAARPVARRGGAADGAARGRSRRCACAPTSPTTSTRRARSRPSTPGLGRRSNGAAPTRTRPCSSARRVDALLGVAL